MYYVYNISVYKIYLTKWKVIIKFLLALIFLYYFGHVSFLEYTNLPFIKFTFQTDMFVIH